MSALPSTLTLVPGDEGSTLKFTWLVPPAQVLLHMSTVTLPTLLQEWRGLSSGTRREGLIPISTTLRTSFPGPAASYAALRGSSPDLAVIEASLPALNSSLSPSTGCPR